MSNNKYLTVAAILVATLILSFGVPKPKYQSLNMLAKLTVPYTLGEWHGQNTKGINLEDERYNFISQAIARIYTDKNDSQLLLFILDAGNFHNPKVCFGSAGFKIREVGNREFTAGGRKFKAHSLFVQRGKESSLVTYWMCIDKKTVDWFTQKTKQLLSSLFNRKKAGFMVRIDIAARPEQEKSAFDLAQKFITELAANLPPEQADYIFGL